MIPGNHLEQVLGRRVFVGEDEGPASETMRRLMVIPCRNVSAASLLTPFQDERPYLARLLLLPLQLSVDIPLGAVEYERLDSGRLRPDSEPLFSVVQQI